MISVSNKLNCQVRKSLARPRQLQLQHPSTARGGVGVDLPTSQLGKKPVLSLGMSLAPGSSFFFVLVDLLTFFSVLAIELVDWSSHTKVPVHEPVIGWCQLTLARGVVTPP